MHDSDSRFSVRAAAALILAAALIVSCPALAHGQARHHVSRGRATSTKARKHAKRGATHRSATTRHAASAQQTAVAAHSMIWGVNPGVAFINFQQSTGPAPTADATAMAGVGIQQVRADAVWAAAVPSSGSTAFTWASTDRMVAFLAAAHLRWYPRIDYTPSFYSENPAEISGGGVQARYLPQLTAYADALAKRYGPGGSFWVQNPGLPYEPVQDYEIWNEPNYPGVLEHSGAAGAAEYMSMYSAAYAGIHAAQPSAVVVFGALAASGTSALLGTESASAWLGQAVAAKPSQPIDAVSVHAYPYDISLNGLVGGVWKQIVPVRAEMDRIGLTATPIQVTEMGFASSYRNIASVSADNGLTFSSAERSEALSTLAVQLARSNCNVDALFPFDWNGAANTSGLAADEAIFTPYALSTPGDAITGQPAQGYASAIAQVTRSRGATLMNCAS